MTDPIRILFTSDVHFGAKGCDAQEMADAFSDTIFSRLSETDIFFINGDFFDDLINFDSFGFDPICIIMHNLIALCEKHRVVLRILQGTWTHDRTQCRRFKTFYDKLGATFDFKFIDGIYVDEIAVRDRSLRIGYVPDDLPYKTSDDIVQVLKDKMLGLGWDYIDYACMHGFFDVTYPKNIDRGSTIVFTVSQFDFVKKLIDCGHVHQYQAVDKFISNGSFDRCVFGDEQPKGCISVLDYPDTYKATFVENKQSAVFDTLVFDDTDTTITMSEKVKAHLGAISSVRKISLRIGTASRDQYQAVETFIRNEYPNVRCVPYRKSSKSDTSVHVRKSSIIEDRPKRDIPTRHNLSSFVVEYVPENYPLDEDKIRGYLQR